MERKFVAIANASNQKEVKTPAMLEKKQGARTTRGEGKEAWSKRVLLERGGARGQLPFYIGKAKPVCYSFF